MSKKSDPPIDDPYDHPKNPPPNQPPGGPQRPIQPKKTIPPPTKK